MLPAWITQLLCRSKSARKRLQSVRRKQFARPSVENLEGRRLLAFTTPISFNTGTNAAGIAVGDFNRDGRDDMAVVNNALAGTVGIMLGNADGSFAPKVDYPAGTNALDATAGDLNGDGKLDLVIVGSAVDVLLGNGDGTFQTALEFPATFSAHSIKVGDFNNDTKLDVATMNLNSASLSLGNGDGTLQTPLNIPVSGNNINLVVGDYNRDGNLDMATSNTASNGTINVLKGHGDGSFEPVVSYYAFSAPVYLAQGDFNEDGYIDFAVPNSYSATSMSIVMNNGDGTYAPPHTYGIGQTGMEIEVDDFNNDGYDDFAVRGSSSYMVSHGKGDGTFYPSVQYPTTVGRFEAGTHGDFNGDGAIDMAYPSGGSVTVLTNDNADFQNLAGTVTFKVTAPTSTTSRSVLPMTISAVDAAGNVATGFRGVVYISSSDAAASTASGYAFNPLDAGIPYVFTAADAGSHSFVGAIRLVTAGDQTVTVSAPRVTPASVHVNVTGQVQRLQVNSSATSLAGDTMNVTVQAIDTLGAIAPGYTTTVQFTSDDPQAVLPADYTYTVGDAGSHTFSVTLKSSGQHFIKVTETGGTINGSANVNVSALAAKSLVLAGGAGAIGLPRPVSIQAQDIYGNAAVSYSGTVHFTSTDLAAVLPANLALVNGAATVNVTFLTVGTQTLTATDTLNASIKGSTTSNATPPVPNKFNVAGYPNAVAGSTNNFTVRVVDTIGQTASSYAGTVYFTSTDVQAGLPASYTFTTADAGVHTFAATLKTSGIQSINVSEIGGLLVGSEGGINVSAAAFSKFLLSVPNGTDSKGHMLVTAGETISLRVRAVDLFGNSTSNYVGTVNFSSSDAAAGLPGSYKFATADGGDHTFNVSLKTATATGQVFSFSVVDSVIVATQTTITNFEVVNAAAATFRLTMPTNIVAGQAFTSKVTAVDAYGNTVKNHFGTVHFATNSANAVLPADYTFNSVDLGVHDFSIILKTAGAATLTASDSSTAAVNGSAAGTVTAAALAKLAVTTSGPVVSGAAVSVTVKAVDSFGNLAAGYRGTVTFSSSDALAGLPANYTFANKGNGSHTFSVILKTVGLQSITVRDTANATIGGTAAGINVLTSAVPGSFAVTGLTATTAGVAQSFTVKVKDSSGNFVTNYLGTVTFSSSDVQAGLPANYTFTAADAGSHSFTVTLKTAGTQSITVRDTVNTTLLGSQAGVLVTAAAPTAIAITGFPATVAGVAKSFTVSMKDAFGNTSSGFTGSVTFSSSDTQAVLPANYTFTAADAGVHSFAGTLKTAGTQSITAKSTTGTMTATQTGIVVTPAAASSLKIAAPATINQGVSVKVTVTAYDAFGNIATGYLGKVTLSSTDPKGSSPSYSFSSRDAGVAQISFNAGTLGAQTIKVIDVANSALVATVAVTVIPK